MWLRFFAALLIALLSGLGVGSAGLLVVFLTTVEQLPQLSAQGLNLLFFLCAGSAALCVHLFRTPILWGLLFILLPTGLLGAFFGTLLAPLLPRMLLRHCFGATLILVGVLGLFKKRGNNGHG